MCNKNIVWTLYRVFFSGWKNWQRESRNMKLWIFFFWGWARGKFASLFTTCMAEHRMILHYAVKFCTRVNNWIFIKVPRNKKFNTLAQISFTISLTSQAWPVNGWVNQIVKTIIITKKQIKSDNHDTNFRWLYFEYN